MAEPAVRMPPSAHSLARDINAGNYDISRLDRCDALFTLDRSPQIVRFTEFTLFHQNTRRELREPHYLTVQPHRQLAARSTRNLEQSLQRTIRDVVESWESELPIASFPRPAESGVSTIRDTIRRLRTSADPEGNPVDLRGLPNINAAPSRIRAGYNRWFNRERNRFLAQRLQTFVANLSGVTEGAIQFTNNDDLVMALSQVVISAEFQTFKTVHPLFAVCATFEQVWELTGYTRGDLLSSLSLGPGDRRILEVHTWDKTTRKTENEVATESEMRASEKMTQRDALTVAQEFARQRNTKVDANGTIPIPKMPVGVTASVANETRDNLRRSRDTTQEQTVEASNTLKINRKTRIEVSRDIGREEKQTYTIENTNRCHTLNYHHFEVVANYLVSNRVTSVRPCVLLPTHRPAMTLDWVLCHEGILRESLLDRIMLPGFDAAKILKTQEILVELDARARLAQLEQIGEQVGPYLTAVVNAYNLLLASRSLVVQTISSCQYAKYGPWGTQLYLVCVANDVSTTDLVRTVSFLALPDIAVQALETLSADVTAGRNHGEALKTFFAAVTPQTFSQVVAPGELSHRLEALGLPPLMIPALLKKDPLTLDDGGLRAAVNASSSAAERASGGTPQPRQEEMAHRELAEARVEFERLLCHLQDNWMHYTQAVSAHEAHGQRFLRLLNEYGAIAGLIENELLGFYGDRAAYPLRDLAMIKHINVDEILETVGDVIEEGPTERSLVTMPTPGVILEAILGQCNACEEFIEQSRVIELRQQAAKARQEEAEATRREQRLRANPPDLSDPKPQNSPEITVRTVP